MKVLVVGSGGREHAIARAFRASEIVTDVFVAPGNDGMKEDATCVAIDELDFASLTAFAKDEQIELTFVGPEAPLAAGIVDAFEKEGLVCFGPNRRAAQLEGSKSFAKELMTKYNIPTAAYGTFTTVEEAKAFIDEQGAPIVVKADGLAAGKGVVVAMTKEEAFEAVEDMIGNQKFGDSSSKVVIEQFLEGEEFSYMSFVHNGHIYPMPLAQDHKRAYDGDKGPNTGGMGAYSPVPQIGQDIVKRAYDEVVVPTVEAMKAEGTPFNGILYAGLILTAEGPKVIEFNARFGDPETQVILPRLASDFGAFMQALVQDKPFELEWSTRAVLGVVVASEGYPGTVQNGHPLPQLTPLRERSIDVFHAGTKREGDVYVGNGGRVLLLTAQGETLKEAQHHVYEAMNAIEWPHFFYRKDIGWRIVDLK